MSTADIQRRMELIRHRLDQFTTPAFDRDDIETLLDEINRLQSCERALQVREQASEHELHRILGTMVQIKERLQIMLAENEALNAKLASYRKVMHPLPEPEDWPEE